MTAMSEVMSLYGLRKLSLMKPSERPKNYKTLVLNYLQYKQDWINAVARVGQLDQKIAKHNIDVFIEAVNLSRKLGVIWKMMNLNY